MRFPSSLPIAALLFVSIAAGAGSAGADTDPLRLTPDVVPTFQAIRLQVDADKPAYTGAVHIDLDVTERTSSFRFHAKDLRLENVTLTKGKEKIGLSHSVDDKGFVTVTTAKPLKKGTYGLDVTFTADFNRQARSLYRVETEGRGYSFTQFEAEYAREAFPCWDEPIFKIPFQMTLVVPRDHMAVSNTPIEEESIEGDLKTVVFERTPPLPSYLLAVATGPFETVDIPGMSVPGRIVTVKGQTHLAGEAVAATPRILAVLEEYFGSAYPYKKLDVIAVPEFLFGAMENVGAVTFRDDLLLMDADKASIDQKRFMTVVMAHELAHMWFGNLVTMKWWDDIWLNEAFATWMAYKSTDVAYPEYQFTTEDVNSRRGAMQTDALPSARAISHPFAAGSDPMELFDELTYQKGQAVLSMIEHWLGEETFRRGMMSYMKKHRWGNASSNDLWEELSRAADVEIGTSMGTFVTRPGVPLVKLEIVQDDVVRLSQRRFENYGQKTQAAEPWHIPMTLKYFDGDRTYTQQVMLSREAQTVELRSGGPIAWVHPNANEKGYYRWETPAQMLEEMAASADELTLRERIAFVDNLSASLDAGGLGGAQYLKALQHFAHDPSPEVAAGVVTAVQKVHDEFVSEDLEDDFALYVRATLRPILDRIGMERRSDESGAVTRLRPRLVRWLGGEGGDEEVRAYALDLADAYDEDRSSVDPSLVRTVLSLAARYGDEKRFEYYKTRFENASTPAERRRYLSAIGNFQDERVVDAALEYALSESVRPNEKARLPVIIARDHRERVVRWALANYDRVEASVPTLHLSWMMPALADGRSETILAEVETFVSDPSRTSPLMQKNMRKVADRVVRRSRVSAKEGPAVALYLAEQSKGY